MPSSDLRLIEITTEDGRMRLPYTLVRRKGLRHLRVTVDQANQVTLKVPYGISEKRGIAFLQQQGDWLKKMLGRPPKQANLRELLERKKAISAWGERVAITLKGNAAKTGWEAIPDDSERPEAFHLLYTGPKEVENQLKTILRDLAKWIIPRRVMELAAHHGLHVARVTIRDQRTRWGSCSESGSISLNWRLLLLPPDLHDHVILHELAHLREMNHSARYYAALEAIDPNWKTADEKLSRISGHVMLMGR